jgi:hypothetical protein
MITTKTQNRSPYRSTLWKLPQKQKDHLKYLRKKHRKEIMDCQNRSEARLLIFEIQLKEDLTRDKRQILNHQRELKKLFKIHPELRSIVSFPAFSYGKKGVKTPYIIGEKMNNPQLASAINRNVNQAMRSKFNEAFKNVDQYFGIASQALAYSVERMCLDLEPNSTVLFTSMLSDKICFDQIIRSLECVAITQLAMKESTQKVLENSFAEARPDEFGIIKANRLSDSSKAFLFGFKEGVSTSSMPIKIAYSIKVLGIYNEMLTTLTRYCERVHQK